MKNWRDEWIDGVEKWQDTVERLRRKYPRRLVKSGYTDTYWDGSFGPRHKYEIWDDSEYEKAYQKALNRRGKRSKLGPAWR